MNLDQGRKIGLYLYVSTYPRNRPYLSRVNCDPGGYAHLATVPISGREDCMIGRNIIKDRL